MTFIKGGSKDMKYIKLLIVPMLFVSLAFMNIGGCGGSGDGNGGGGGGIFCEMPTLTTNFSNRAYIFDDFIRNAELAVTSDGQFTAIAISDIPGLAVVANVDDANNCTITGISDGVFVVLATGTCERQADGDAFIIRNLSSLGEDFPLYQGFCATVEFFNSTSSNLYELGTNRAVGFDPEEESDSLEIIDRFLEKFYEIQN